MKSLIIAGLLLSASVQAATFSIGTYEEGGTYIEMEGETTIGDKHRLINTIELAEDFTGVLYLNGTGGNANTGIAMAKEVSARGLRTVVEENDGCYSACALIWMSGGEERYIQGNGIVGFHFAYTQDLNYINEIKERHGWNGVQDAVAQWSHAFTAEYFEYGIAQPAVFMRSLASQGSIATMFEVTEENIAIVGGRVY